LLNANSRVCEVEEPGYAEDRNLHPHGSAERQTAISRAGGRTSVPQIFIDGAHIGGCDDLVALNRAGRLDPLLAA
jgi:glutaredoxin 3